MLLFLITENGPRAAKISWRAALWPCLVWSVSVNFLLVKLIGAKNDCWHIFALHQNVGEIDPLSQTRTTKKGEKMQKKKNSRGRAHFFIFHL